jgi:hypothetical protein
LATTNRDNIQVVTKENRERNGECSEKKAQMRRDVLGKIGLDQGVTSVTKK